MGLRRGARLKGGRYNARAALELVCGNYDGALSLLKFRRTENEAGDQADVNLRDGIVELRA